MGGLDGVQRICGLGLPERDLRAAVLAELRRVIPFDYYAWLLTDPETCVGTAPLAQVPSLRDLPTLVRLKYLTPTNRWTGLAAGTASTLLAATGGVPSRSLVWRELLAGYGVSDVASVVFRDQFGCWGWLDLWRTAGPFTDDECLLLGGLDAMFTPALRRDLTNAFSVGPPQPHPRAEPVVLLLSVDLAPLTQTPLVEENLRALLPTDGARAPIPAPAYNVAAQLLARELGVDDHAPSARAHQENGNWVTVSAARLGPGSAGIAVTIEPTAASHLAGMFARVIGLTERETELLGHLVAGADTRELARVMFLSEHTVQDHLKSIFAKAGVHSRRLLVARATGMQ